MTRLLVLRPGALGDLLLAVPALTALRTQVSEPHITLVGHGEAASLLQRSSLVDVAISQDDRRLLSLYLVGADSPIEPEEFSGIDLAVAWLTDAEGTVAANLRRLGAKKTVIAPSKPPAGTRVHASDHLSAALEQIGIAPLARQKWVLKLPDGEETLAKMLERCGCKEMLRPGPTSSQDIGEPRCNNIPMVAIHPGSGSARKNWAATKYAAVADTLASNGAVVLILSGPADEGTIDAVASHLKRPVPITKDLSLAHLAAILSRCSAYLGNDSGVTHLASLVGLPTFALFGPTDPAIWAPRGDRVTVLRWDGDRGAIAPEEVVQAILEGIMNRGQLP